MPEPCPRPGALDHARTMVLGRGWRVGVVAVAVFSLRLGRRGPLRGRVGLSFPDLLRRPVAPRASRKNPAWLDYPAYDLPPLPKYLIGLALAGGGFRRPGPAAARAWYLDTSSRFDPPGALVLARWPFGALRGARLRRGLRAGRRSPATAASGALAALLLIVNPLYRLHARRAMSDVPAEAFILCAAWRAALGLAATARGGFGPNALGRVGRVPGVCGGLAALAKFERPARPDHRPGLGPPDAGAAGVRDREEARGLAMAAIVADGLAASRSWRSIRS